MDIINIDVSKDPRWDRFVAKHPSATIYHHSSWKKVLEKTYGYKAVYLAVTDQKNNVQAGLPLFYINSRLTGNRFVSLPGFLYHDLIVWDQNDQRSLVLLGYPTVFYVNQNHSYLVVLRKPK